MRHLNALALSLGMALSLAAVARPAAAQAPERFTLAGEEVAIYNLAGEVTVEPGTGPAVVVTVSRGGPDAARLLVATGPIKNRATLRVIYPGDRILYARPGHGFATDVSVQDDGTFGGRRNGERRVRISSRGGDLEAHANLAITVPRGKQLAVHLAAGEVVVRNVDGHLSLNTSAAAVRTSGTSGTLDIDVGSGSVEVAGASGEIRVDTGSGSVQATDLRGSRIMLETGSGSVRGQGLTAPEVMVETGSGRVELTNVAAEQLMVETGSGGVQLDLTSSPRDLRIETGSGSVTVRAAALDAEVDIETGSGSINSDFPITITRRERDALRGRIGSGAGRLSVETGSGSVALRRR